MPNESWSTDELTVRVWVVIVLVLATLVCMWSYAANHGLDVLLPISGR